MGLDAALVMKMITPQRSWRREDAFDAMFLLRIFIGAFAGILYGVLGVQGLPYFLTFLAMNFMGANAWLSYQDISVEEIEAANGANSETTSPSASLIMEGFAQSLPLFLASLFVYFDHIFFYNLS